MGPDAENTPDEGSVQSALSNLILMKTLDPALLPQGDISAAETSSSRRLVFVGDVHGCRDELEQLLQKVSFDPNNDHLILTGDLINKGPDSLGAVDLARRYSASCVRGNHEDRILRLRRKLFSPSGAVDEEKEDKHDARDRPLALALSDDQAQWLEACPVILKIGCVPGMGQVAVVHGGVVPGVELEKQDPESVMTMLTIDSKTGEPSSKRGAGDKWAKVYNKHQSAMLNKSKPKEKVEGDITTIIYGHDSKNSLSLKQYTKGLDSGCVKGGQLTALIVGAGGQQEIVQVECDGYEGKK
ncbi:Metallo-dependent phosphatase [Aspergillus campestris IBT 28561]|uniref:Metallo-dependent phosphatase n=1 Tax=Aspergillus campestris (strain IBT 28561) TaxID=1392248 RepID=A0A2I1D951_ASPC2|nr:Metallo-dependent phosphatase [Aspergillus campestris IBT 28561]PKY06387.1 Metallo-dependent phosphatase [Aspergillus campestris IBT 28561]